MESGPESGEVCLDVIAGCYERTVLGYEVVFQEKDDTYKIRAKFTDNSHIGYIKAIAASETFLASGSTDETIHLYNLKKNTELGTLLQHDGSITCIRFHEDSNMLSSSEDSTLCVWNTDSWDCMKTLKGHKGGVNCFAIHPSGKLALSVGADKTLRTWNLLKGRAAYTTNIKLVADHVMWSPDGEIYIVITGSNIDVYNITTATISCTINIKSRIQAVAFVTDRVIAVGGDGNNISLLEIGKSDITCIHTFEAHENRIKALQCVPACRTSASAPASNHMWLLSASSDGYIKLWNLDTNELNDNPESLLAEVSTTARLTCLTVRQMGGTSKEQKKHKQIIATEEKTTTKQTTTKRSKPTEKSGGKVKKRKSKPKPITD